MVVWINGPYGVGKSTLAEKLHERDPESFIFDAEAVGNAVRDNLPRALYNGAVFEAYPLWFSFCAELLRKISAGFGGHVYVPMTLVYKDSFARIAQPLAESGVAAKHILLVSTHEIVHDRILARGEDEGCWCMENIDLCLKNQREFDDVIRIESTGKTADELADEVLGTIGA